MGTTPNFVAISALALAEGGPALLASLTVTASLFYIALALWLPLLRRVITPVVSGTILMLLAVTILPVAFDRVREVPTSAPDAAGPTIILVALAVTVAMALRASGPMAPVVAGDRNCGWLCGRGPAGSLRRRAGGRCALGGNSPAPASRAST